MSELDAAALFSHEESCFVDALGVRHVPHGASARIVSLVPSVTECLIELGLADRVVGRTTFCIHPGRRVSRIARVGGTKTPSIDRIAALEPTHVVMNVDENRDSDARALSELGIPVITTHPLEPIDNLALYKLLGGIFNARARAERMAQAFTDAHRALAKGCRARTRRRVLYLIWRDPYMTVSRDTYISRMLALAGLETEAPATGERYPVVELTPDALRDIDAVLLASEPFPFKVRHADEIRAALAPRAPAIEFIDGEMTSWYGSRAIAGCRYLGAFAERLSRQGLELGS